MAERLIDRVLDPRFIDSLGEVDQAGLEARMADAAEAEREVSAVRRKLHRVINALQTELATRS